MSATASPATLIYRWDSGWLLLDAGPVTVVLAYVEDYSDGGSAAFVCRWAHLGRQDASTAHFPGGAGKPNDDPSDTLEVPARDHAEGVAIVRALLALRGIEVPEEAAPTAGAGR